MVFSVPSSRSQRDTGDHIYTQCERHYQCLPLFQLSNSTSTLETRPGRPGQADQAWAEKGRSRAPEGTTTCPEGTATRDNEDRVSPSPVPSLVLQI